MENNNNSEESTCSTCTQKANIAYIACKEMATTEAAKTECMTKWVQAKAACNCPA